MHTVDNLVISCIDFRFRPKIAAWIKEELDDQADLVAIAGASKAILDDDTQASVLKQVVLAKKLHDIKTVHLIDHIDCGAYGGSKSMENEEAEIAMHKEKLEAASQKIKEACPDVSVECYLIGFDGLITI